MAWAAERAVGASRVVGVVAHIVAVFWLGWLVAIRRLVGDLVLVDELLAVLPVVVLFVAGWTSLYPIDRRIREAVIVRSLDEGLPIEPYVSLSAHVISFLQASDLARRRADRACPRPLRAARRRGPRHLA